MSHRDDYQAENEERNRRIADAIGSVLEDRERLKKDSQRLDWLISNRARILDASDSEFCTVYWFDTVGEYETRKCDDAREAIDAAMKGQYSQIG